MDARTVGAKAGGTGMRLAEGLVACVAGLGVGLLVRHLYTWPVGCWVAGPLGALAAVAAFHGTGTRSDRVAVCGHVGAALWLLFLSTWQGAVAGAAPATLVPAALATLPVSLLLSGGRLWRLLNWNRDALRPATPPVRRAPLPDPTTVRGESTLVIVAGPPISDGVALGGMVAGCLALFFIVPPLSFGLLYAMAALSHALFGR